MENSIACTKLMCGSFNFCFNFRDGCSLLFPHPSIVAVVDTYSSDDAHHFLIQSRDSLFLNVLFIRSMEKLSLHFFYLISIFASTIIIKNYHENFFHAYQVDCRVFACAKTSSEELNFSVIFSYFLTQKTFN